MTLPVRVLALAKAFVNGEQTAVALSQRGAAVLGRPERMVRPVADRYLATFASATRPRVRDVARFLLNDRAWKRRRKTKSDDGRKPPTTALHVRPLWLTTRSEMQPVPAASTWPVPPLTSVGALAEWLSLTIDELDWLADAKGRLRRDAHSRLHHYHYRVVNKRRGGVRLIEAPQARLKAIQRQILHEILDHPPTYYQAAHGFVKGRSVRTFAEGHVNKSLVLKLDLQDFFPRIGRARVQAIFRTIGYPEATADVLGALCTNVIPAHVFSSAAIPNVPDDIRQSARRMYARPHLPQGAPTSPALANLCAYRLDCRLTGLADWAGAEYSRYADDLVFSGGGEFARHVHRYAAQIAAIVHHEGWAVHHHKTRIMRAGVRQQIAGVVVNERINIPRAEFDALKAILTNCLRHGPASQNRDQHRDFRVYLLGRLSWISSLNPAKAERLRRLFEKINWS